MCDISLCVGIVSQYKVSSEVDGTEFFGDAKSLSRIGWFFIGISIGRFMELQIFFIQQPFGNCAYLNFLHRICIYESVQFICNITCIDIDIRIFKITDTVIVYKERLLVCIFEFLYGKPVNLFPSRAYLKRGA